MAVTDCAASARVGESVREPAKYYHNKVAQTINLLAAMLATSINNLVFSSTGAAYGIPSQIHIFEDCPQKLFNPYNIMQCA